MPSSSNGEAADALLGAVVTILSIFVVALLALVCYLYFQLRQIHRQYGELTHESTPTPTLSQRIREQRKSAISHIIAEDDLEQQRDHDIGSPISQRSGYSTGASEGGGPGLLAHDIAYIEPGSPETEPWAIRKVRSMERLTSLTNELSTKPDRRDPFREPAPYTQDHNPFYDREGVVKYNFQEIQKAFDTTQNKKGDKDQAPKPEIPEFKSLETAELGANGQQGSRNKRSIQMSDSSLLAVPQPSSPSRCPPLQSKSTSTPPFSTQEPRSERHELNVPPHARSTVPQFPSEDPSHTVNKIYLTESQVHDDISPLECYNTYDVPRPFIDRSFSLTLAYSDQTNDTVPCNRGSRGIKLKQYLKSARNNRRSLANVPGKFSSRSKSLIAIVPKPQRRLVRLTKSNDTGHAPKDSASDRVLQDKLETIDEFQKES
ncbi:hypothetical protein TWF730_000020 [Orbilia blumenaviensis]|uniref:Uncharacterized protein n=1 Tax=Orbilia blumenaviensis TaxID=1796055 RepID=A0AAV9VKI6_9PEZI